MIEDRMERERRGKVFNLFSGFFITLSCVLVVFLYSERKQRIGLESQLEALETSSKTSIKTIKTQSYKNCMKRRSYNFEKCKGVSQRVFSALEACVILYEEEGDSVPLDAEGYRQYSAMERLVSETYAEYYELYGDEEGLKQWSRTGYIM